MISGSHAHATFSLPTRLVPFVRHSEGDKTEARNAVFTAGGPFLATGTLSPLTVIPSLSMIKAWKRSTATNCVAISKR